VPGQRVVADNDSPPFHGIIAEVPPTVSALRGHGTEERRKSDAAGLGDTGTGGALSSRGPHLTVSNQNLPTARAKKLTPGAGIALPASTPLLVTRLIPARWSL